MWYLRHEIVLVLAISSIALSEDGSALGAHSPLHGCSSSCGKTVNGGSKAPSPHQVQLNQAQDVSHDLLDAQGPGASVEESTGIACRSGLRNRMGNGVNWIKPEPRHPEGCRRKTSDAATRRSDTATTTGRTKATGSPTSCSELSTVGDDGTIRTNERVPLGIDQGRPPGYERCLDPGNEAPRPEWLIETQPVAWRSWLASAMIFTFTMALLLSWLPLLTGDQGTVNTETASRVDAVHEAWPPTPTCNGACWWPIQSDEIVPSRDAPDRRIPDQVDTGEEQVPRRNYLDLGPDGQSVATLDSLPSKARVGMNLLSRYLVNRD